MPNPLCHFELSVKDTAKAQEFYGKVFDWQFKSDPEMGGYTMINTGGEPGGGMMKMPEQAPHPSLNSYFLVDDIEATLAKVKELGGQQIVGKTEIPGMGYWAFFLDPDGIAVGIYESKK